MDDKPNQSAEELTASVSEALQRALDAQERAREAVEIAKELQRRLIEFNASKRKPSG